MLRVEGGSAGARVRWRVWRASKTCDGDQHVVVCLCDVTETIQPKPSLGSHAFLIAGDRHVSSQSNSSFNPFTPEVKTRTRLRISPQRSMSVAGVDASHACPSQDLEAGYEHMSCAGLPLDHVCPLVVLSDRV
jgi:hypothetical protein